MPLLHYLCRHVHYSVPPRLAAQPLSFCMAAHPLTFGPLTPAGSIYPIYLP